MKSNPFLSLLIFVGLLFWSDNSIAQSLPDNNNFVYGDPLPDAPELAPRGDYKVGVRTLQLINPNQLDVANAKGGEISKYDRPLTIEVWYPAIIPEGKKEKTQYEDVLGRPNAEERPLTPFTFDGRALRDAEPDRQAAAYPLIIVSHGYPGSRYLMTYLTENLASKGYVVVAIDHTESTHRDVGPFPSTLINRPLDVLFILDEMAKRGSAKNETFLSGLLDADNTALIGYSMGGYGVLNVAGAGYSPKLVETFSAMTGGNTAVQSRAVDAPALKAPPDARIKAVVAFAPWGMARGAWDSTGVAGLRIPTFFIAGDQDDVSGYDDGIKALYEGSTNTERFLLTYVNARHNVAPNPPPVAATTSGANPNDYMHYAEPAWDLRRINNINQHFVTAFLGIRLKGLDYQVYLELPENTDGELWKGFQPRTAVGLEWRSAEKE